MKNIVIILSLGCLLGATGTQLDARQRGRSVRRRARKTTPPIVISRNCGAQTMPNEETERERKVRENYRRFHQFSLEEDANAARAVRAAQEDPREIEKNRKIEENYRRFHQFTVDTPRKAERARRRQENAKKFCSHIPAPKKESSSFFKSVRSTIVKMLIGAGIGLGALYAYNNPAIVKSAVKAAWKSASEAISGCFSKSK